MTSVRILTPEALVEQVRAKLETEPYEPGWHDYMVAPDPTNPAAYALIVGAGFSHGVVPLVRELMHETIGGYYIPDQDQSAMERPTSVLQEHSRDFWAEFNKAAAANRLPVVAVDGRGLPEDPGAAYQYLFTYEGANALFAFTEREEREPSYRQLSYVEQLQQRRDGRSANEKPQEPQDTGERFLKGFLRYVMDIGSEHGYGSTGRSDLNPAHVYLAALLEAQQTGVGWNTRAFCRMILTTNFDTLLQNCLQLVSLLYAITDRPEKGFATSEFAEDETVIHLVYNHGSILRHNPASTTTELGQLTEQNVSVLRDYLESRDIITIGYSGWNDGLMAALRQCNSSGHYVYCCDVRPDPPPNIAELLREQTDYAAYVPLGSKGANGLLRSLYHALVSKEAQRDPMQRYRQWQALRWNR
jgi:hypothetical protein